MMQDNDFFQYKKTLFGVVKIIAVFIARVEILTLLFPEKSPF
jgi:hypothetical protein